MDAKLNRGCSLDTDGDGDCPIYPNGCPPTMEKEPNKCVVRLSTARWSNKRGLYEKWSITFLRRQCSGFNVLEEDISMVGGEEVLPKITNLDECKDGIYDVVTCNERRDWETGVVDEYDYKLLPHNSLETKHEAETLTELTEL